MVVKSRISLRVSTFLWMNSLRQADLLAWMKEYGEAVEEVAFFTSFTHPPLPLTTITERAAILAELIPRFQALGVCAGINHLSTLGHLDENPENSLNEPWQHMVDMDGSVSKSCYCAEDRQFHEYLKQVYVTLSQTRPEFIWVDDDVRMESHPQAIKYGCFCDLCLAKFSKESGHNWSREELKQAFKAGTHKERLVLRQLLLEHNRTYITDLLTRIRTAVDSVNPDIKLGLMTGELSYSGYGFAPWADAMAGKRAVEVKWRPGGGFYTDDQPFGMVGKAHSIGRQIGFLPAAVADIQSEHENFPYQTLKKSTTCFMTEIAAYIGAGCTGTALNCMGMSSDPIDEYRPYFDAVKKSRRFLDKAVATFGRSRCEGLWVACTKDYVATLHVEEGEWPTGSWGGSMHSFGELSEIGLPMAYTKVAASSTLLSGDIGLGFSEEELVKILSGGVMMDGAALHCLNSMGLSEYTGFAIRERKDKDTTELFTADPLNGKFAGWHRDCRPSFWGEAGYLLSPLTAESRVIAEAIDFTPVNYGATSGAFENRLGGRVAVLGYYPWRSVHTLAKSSQMKALCRWLSRDGLPGYVASYNKAALWCRRDSKGDPALLLVNASVDTVEGIDLYIRNVGERLTMTRMDSTRIPLAGYLTDPPYVGFKLPRLTPWEAVLIASE